MLGAILGGLGATVAGNILSDQIIGDPNSAKAWQRQKHFYQHRYQWMMDDMRKAGLNPILAAGSAGFSTGGTPTPQMSTLPQQDYASTAKSLAETGLAQEETRTEQVRQLKVMAEVKTEIERKFEVRNKAHQATAAEKQHLATIQNLWQQIHKMRDEQGILKVEKEVAMKRYEQLVYQLTELATVAEVYKHPAGQWLQVIKQIMGGLNVGVGIIPRLGKN